MKKHKKISEQQVKILEGMEKVYEKLIAVLIFFYAFS